jgi:hypothetical protein
MNPSVHSLSALVACGALLIAALACKGKQDAPTPDPVTTAAASAPVMDETPSAAPSASEAPVVEKPKATVMAVPSPTTDRFSRNRDKDLPCPPKFTEQPGAEQFSTCARDCKTDSDCHGHKCDDSMVGDGKVCSEEKVAVAPKGQGMSFDGKGAPCPDGYGQGSMDNPGVCRKKCTTPKDCTKNYGCRDDHFCYFDD